MSLYAEFDIGMFEIKKRDCVFGALVADLFTKINDDVHL